MMFSSELKFYLKMKYISMHTPNSVRFADVISRNGIVARFSADFDTRSKSCRIALKILNSFVHMIFRLTGSRSNESRSRHANRFIVDDIDVIVGHIVAVVFEMLDAEILSATRRARTGRSNLFFLFFFSKL